MTEGGESPLTANEKSRLRYLERLGEVTREADGSWNPDKGREAIKEWEYRKSIRRLKARSSRR